MLKLKNITKTYVDKKDKSRNVTALKNISIDFPRQGFVSILGPSGCGKTTLLNILGGLDTNYKGDFIVNGVDTKEFAPKDWDAYRNNHVGFVFQEYNLIPHQNVSRNVELVLTIAGASKVEVKENSKKVLADVGLEEKVTQNPNNLSGGQKQRVAIARAIVNNPELVLADEPTSALDSKTSEQVMDILKEISKKKLVIMVTHNVELARKYSSRIINILDGEVKSDEVLEGSQEKEEFLKQLPQTYKFGKSKMKFKTATELSFKNLMGKKRRTILTILAGCIGIVCLSIILGIINGSKSFTEDLSDIFLKRHPFVIDRFRPMDANIGDVKTSIDATTRIVQEEEEKASSSSTIKNPSGLKDRIEKEYSKFENTKENVLVPEYQNHVVELLNKYPDAANAISVKRPSGAGFLLKTKDGYFKEDHSFSEMPYSNNLDEQFELIGQNSRWPTAKEEVVAVLDSLNNWEQVLINASGLKDKKEFQPEDIIGKEVGCWVPYNLMYRQADGMFSQAEPSQYKEIYEHPSSVKLKIVGVVKPKHDKDSSYKGLTGFTRMLFQNEYPLRCGIVYTKALGDYIYENSKNAEIIKAQKQTNEPVLVSEKTNDDVYESKKKVPISVLLRRLGYYDNAGYISIFIRDPSKNKKKIVDYLKSYNEGKSDENSVILSQDSQTENFVNVIRSICIALMFTVGLASLVTSLIMVALLEFISVIERTKEIGVLRSIGARRKDIARVFKSEALIIGFFTGVVGVGIGFIFSIPINIFIRNRFGVEEGVNFVQISPMILISLTLFSLFVTLLAGLIPAKIAARKDPVRILTGANN